MNRKRHLALRLSNFMTAADFCETSDLLFYLPRIVAQRIALGRNIVLKPVPDELQSAPISFYLYWHERHHSDPMCRWIRQRILQVI